MKMEEIFMINTINYFNYNREVVLNRKKVIILFDAPWTFSGQGIMTAFENWSKEYNLYDFKKVDIVKSKALAKKFKIVSTPTYVVVDGGKELKRFLGVQNDETFKYFMTK